MSWLIGNKVFTPDDIPEGAVGFIYRMTVIFPKTKQTPEQTLHYIGKKNFYANVKVKMGKKEIAKITDKRLKKYRRIQKLAYEEYYSSNEFLKAAHKSGIHIEREILHICYSKLMLSYWEMKILFELDVLFREDFLNQNIGGKFYKERMK